MPHFLVQRRFHPGLLIVLIALVCTGAFALNQATRAGASQDTVVSFVPVGDTRAGALITVKLVGTNVRDLAGFQGTVHFDQQNLRLTGATVEKGLAASGRGVLPLGPVMRDGSVVLGAATCPISDCSSATPQLESRIAQGVSGQVELGTLEFYSGTPGSYNLTLDGLQFVDAQGNRLTVRAEPLVLQVQS